MIQITPHMRILVAVEPYDTSPLEGSLAWLGPVEIRLVRRAEGEPLFAHLLSRYHLLESFVDIERFRGTCYRAANWTCVGRSVGRGTKSKSKQPVCSIKELWVYPLAQNLSQRLLQKP